MINLTPNSKLKWFFQKKLLTILILLQLLPALMQSSHAAVNPQGYVKYQAWRSDSSSISLDGITSTSWPASFPTETNPDKSVEELTPIASYAYLRTKGVFDLGWTANDLQSRVSAELNLPPGAYEACIYGTDTDAVKLFFDDTEVAHYKRDLESTYTAVTRYGVSGYEVCSWINISDPIQFQLYVASRNHGYGDAGVFLKSGPLGDYDLIPANVSIDSPATRVSDLFTAQEADSDLTFVRHKTSEFTDRTNIVSGVLRYELYSSSFDVEADLSEIRATGTNGDFVPDGYGLPLTPNAFFTKSGITSTPTADTLYTASDIGDTDAENITIRYSGFLSIETEGEYEFVTAADDRSGLWIDGYTILTDEIYHDYTPSTKVYLTPGEHEIVALFLEKSGEESYLVTYSGPDTESLPAALLQDKDTASDGIGVVSRKLYIYDQLDSSTSSNFNYININPNTNLNCTGEAIKGFASYMYNNNNATTGSTSFNQAPTNYLTSPSVGVVSGLNQSYSVANGAENENGTTNISALIGAVDSGDTDHFKFRFLFHQYLETSGTYYFRLHRIDDYLWVIIDGQVVAYLTYDNYDTVTDFPVTLSAGSHKVEVLFGDTDGGEKMKLLWTPSPLSSPPSPSGNYAFFEPFLFNSNSYSDRICEDVNAQISTFTASPSRVFADGIETSDMIVTLYADSGNKVTWGSEKIGFELVGTSNAILSEPNNLSTLDGEFQFSAKNLITETTELKAYYSEYEKNANGALVFDSSGELQFIKRYIPNSSSRKTIEFYNIEASLANITNLSEPSTNGAFSVMLSETASFDITINYSVTGSAVSGSDYTTLSGSVFIPAGNLSVSVPILVLNDGTPENSKTLTVTLDNATRDGSNTDGITFPALTKTANITVQDDDNVPPPTPTVSVNSNGTLTVTGTGDPNTNMYLTFPDSSTQTVATDDSGDYNTTSSTVQSNGNVSVTTDRAGVISPPATVTYTDTTAPTTPVVSLSPSVAKDGTSVSASITSVEVGSEVTLQGMSCTPSPADSSGVVNCTGVVGNASLDGTNNTITVTDAQGNANTSASTGLIVDNHPPANPIVSTSPSPAADGTSVTTSLSNVEDGATVTVVGMLCAPIPADNSGLVACTGVVGTNGLDGVDTTVSVTDMASNVNTSTQSGLVVDNVALPPTQTVTVNTDGTLSLSGTGEAGATVTVTFPDTTMGTAVVNDTGNYGPITSAAPQTSGAVSSSQTDSAGNDSAAVSDAYTDNTAPLAPTQAVAVNNNGTLTVTGTGEPGSTVTITFPDGSTGTSVVTDAGSYGPLVSAVPQTNGNLRASQTDQASNVSPTNTETYTDTTDPLAPTQVVTVNSNGTLNVSGTGEAGSSITVTYPNGSSGTAVVDAAGNYGPVISALSQSSGNISSTQTDTAGNVSSQTTEIYVDNVAPSAPTQLITENPDGTLLVSGTGEPGSTVKLTYPDSSTATTVVDASGNYGPLTSALPQTSGNITADQTDTAGNASAPIVNTFTDTTAPLTPTQTHSANENGTLSVSGTGEAGSTVTIIFSDGSSDTALVDNSGNYGPVTSVTPHTSGNIRASQTDAASNTSATATEPYMDTTAPLAVTQLIATNTDGTLSITGTGETGSIVTVTFPDNSTGSALVDASGHFGAINSANPQTSGNVSSSQTDAASNTSSTVTYSYTDITPPWPPYRSSPSTLTVRSVSVAPVKRTQR